MRTVLPEKWYVVRTPENAQELNEWADSVVDDPEEWERRTVGFVLWHGGSMGPRWFPSEKCVEITYEEFTKIVLKKGV